MTDQIRYVMLGKATFEMEVSNASASASAPVFDYNLTFSHKAL